MSGYRWELLLGISPPPNTELRAPATLHLCHNHPIMAESRDRAFIAEEERVLRECLVDSLAQRLVGLRYKPEAPRELFVDGDPQGCLSSDSRAASSGSLYSTATSATQNSPVRRESDAREKLLESQKVAMLNTGDIDALLKQMQRKHADDYRRNNNFAKVHYHTSHETVLKSRLHRIVREEDELRNDIEIVEGLMLERLVDNHQRHSLSRLMELQLAERRHRVAVETEAVERFEELLVRLRSATEAFDVTKLAQLTSPERYSPFQTAGSTPMQPTASSPQLVRGTSALGSRRRRVSQAVDNQWIESFLSSQESQGRADLDEERGTQLQHLADGFRAVLRLLDEGMLTLNGDGGYKFSSAPGPSAEQRKVFVAIMALVVEDEENLHRYQIDVLYEHELRRVSALYRTVTEKFLVGEHQPRHALLPQIGTPRGANSHAQMSHAT